MASTASTAAHPPNGTRPRSPTRHQPLARVAQLWRPVLRLAISGGVIVAIVVMVRGLAAGELVEALANARVWPLIAASAIAIGVYALKAVSWRIMLAPRFPLRLSRLVRYTIVAFAASAITPARAGEVIRIWLLKRRDGVDAATSIAVATSEKAMDVFTLLVVAAPLPWLLLLPAWLEHGMWVLACMTVAAIPAVVLLGRRVRPDSWWGRFLAALERRPRQLLAVFFVLLVGWFADIVAVLLVMYALDISVSWPGALLVLFVVNVAIALPSTPAQLGTHQLGALIPLVDILHVAKEPAVAFALVYHATQILPTLVLGIALEWRLLLKPDRN
jgi:glycosyltransferase 2 family protein